MLGDRREPMRRWSDMNHYAEAKTEDVLEILSWARAWQLRIVPILARSRSPSASRRSTSGCAPRSGSCRAHATG